MMTVKQQETIDRNNRVIEFLEKHINIFQYNSNLILFFSKLKKDNARAILSAEAMKNDTSGSSIKVATKIIVTNTAVYLCNRAMTVLNLKEGQDFSVAMQFNNDYFFEATDNLALERLTKIHNLLIILPGSL